MSKARARLFDLADLVRNGDDTVVILEERGSGEGVALVREARLNYLEDAVKDREKLEPRPLSVAGSLSSPLDDDDLQGVMSELRKAWSQQRRQPRQPRQPRQQ
jgi:hypothetical protein